MSRIVVFGATGYTGDLVARALVARGATPVLAARNPERLASLAAELGGLETAVADVSDPDSVRSLVGKNDVLVSTVGPFSRWGKVAVEAAIEGGAHYLDSTGEGPFIRDVFERYGPRAEKAGVGLVTAFGYDWVPGNLAGALALSEAGERARRVEVAYFIRSTGEGDPKAAKWSGGTKSSVVETLTEPAFAFSGGRLVTERGARRVRNFQTRPGGKAKPAITVGGSEHYALPRQSPHLRDVEVFLGWFGPLSRPLQVSSALSAPLMKVPGAAGVVKKLGAKLVKGSTGGPDAEARRATGSVVLATAYDEVGSALAEVRLEGVNAYTFTGDVLAWGAQTIAAGGLQGAGALGPVDGFGLEALTEGVAQAGITRL